MYNTYSYKAALLKQSIRIRMGMCNNNKKKDDYASFYSGPAAPD